MIAPSRPVTAPIESRTTRKGIHPWPASILATFAVFITGIVGLVIVAGKDRDDLVAADYYEQEIRYQRRIDQLRRTEPHSAEILATYETGEGRVRVSLPRDHAASAPRGEIRLYRPNDARADRTIPLSVDASGVQHVPVDGFGPGLWKVRLQWMVGTDEFYADRQIRVPGTRSGGAVK